jgi:signal transduction histidine kinase
MSRLGRVAVGGLGLAAGVATLAIARDDPGDAYAGDSVADGALELAAGWSAIVAGLAARDRRFGRLLVAAGFAWFAREWANPGVGSPLVFTAGLLAVAACAPFVADAAVRPPRGVLARAAVVAAYIAGIGLLGLLATATFDPAAQGCLACPRNLLLVHADPGAYDAAVRWGLRGLLVSLVAVVAAGAWRALPAAAAFLGLVAVDVVHSLRTNVLGNDQFDLSMWRAEAVALVAVAGTVAWRFARTLRARAATARLVVELGEAERSGAARDALARALGDDSFELVFGVVEPRPGRAVTPLLSAGRPVAALVHDPALLRDPGRLDHVVRAARLAIDNERFHAELRAQLGHLRAARARIVEAGDAERRRLERDLHDGAQQRLVAVAIALRLLRRSSGPASAGLEARLDEADAELAATIVELRDLAHGLFPTILAEEGFAAAIETLVDTSPARLHVCALPDERLDGNVEAAAYFVIAESLRRARATRAELSATRRDGRFVVDLSSDGAGEDSLTDLEDRVGALDGHLAIDRAGGGLRLRAELPCA